MRSLFVKIFLWFWLSQLLMLGAFALVQRQLADPPRMPSETTMRGLAHEVSPLLHAQDRVALGRLLAELDDGSPLRFYLFDSAGTELTGRRVSAEFVRYLRQTVDSPPLSDYRQRRNVAVQPLLTGDGRYLLVAARSPRSRLGELPVWARLGIAAALSAAFCLLLATYLSRPIRRLRGATQALAAGDLSARVHPPRGRDELAELSRDFNAMAARLQTLIESQTQLLQDVSHELRSPLARLQVALELARKRAGEPATGPLDRIELEAERLNELIGQVLTLARMESGNRRPVLAPVPLIALCREIVDDASFEAGLADKQVVIHEVEQAEELIVTGDAVLLRSAIENVVRNALRYTAPHSRVELSLRAERSQAIVTVRDHGPGLPEAELERVFEPFVRASAARERDSGGYGLGLAIAKRTALLHGGSVSAANAEGGGLIVTLALGVART